MDRVHLVFDMKHATSPTTDASDSPPGELVWSGRWPRGEGAGR